MIEMIDMSGGTCGAQWGKDRIKYCIAEQYLRCMHIGAKTELKYYKHNHTKVLCTLSQPLAFLTQFLKMQKKCSKTLQIDDFSEKV